MYICIYQILQICNYIYIYIYIWAGIAQSVQRLATGWTVRVSNSGEGEIFRSRPDRPWGFPSRLCNGYQVFPGGNATGAWRRPPTLSNAKVKERVELLYLNSPYGPSWTLSGWTYIYIYTRVCVCVCVCVCVIKVSTHHCMRLINTAVFTHCGVMKLIIHLLYL